MKKILFTVFFIIVVYEHAFAQWYCDEWGAWMSEWGITFWFRPIATVILGMAIAVAILYLIRWLNH